MKKGRFITFEGIEGSGKSTQLLLAADWLRGEGLTVVETREPGGTAIGNEIRKILLSEKTTDMTSTVELALYLADRFQHIEQVIRPGIENGDIVLCDRYHDSTIAYQGYARGLSLDWMEELWNGSGISLEPDMTILFDLDPEAGIRRSLRKLEKHNMDESRFEKESIEFHSRVRHGFLSLAKQYPDRYFRLDGSLPTDSVHQEVKQILKGKLNL